jgi:hypothetical protein
MYGRAGEPPNPLTAVEIRLMAALMAAAAGRSLGERGSSRLYGLHEAGEALLHGCVPRVAHARRGEHLAQGTGKGQCVTSEEQRRLRPRVATREHPVVQCVALAALAVGVEGDAARVEALQKCYETTKALQPAARHAAEEAAFLEILRRRLTEHFNSVAPAAAPPRKA